MKPFSTNPQEIVGSWSEGFALDLHTTSSDFIGHDEYGHAMFDTVRSEVGEALYKLKYSRDPSQVARLAATASAFVKTWKWRPDAVVPVPASRVRTVPPVGWRASTCSGAGQEPQDPSLR